MGLFSGKEKPKDKAAAKPEEAKVTVTATKEAINSDKLDPVSEKEKLIRIAATFLANPNIEKESLELKTAFLKRKGLDDAMIKQAFDMYKDKVRMQQEEKELKEELESIKAGGKSKQSALRFTRLVGQDKKSGQERIPVPQRVRSVRDPSRGVLPRRSEDSDLIQQPPAGDSKGDRGPEITKSSAAGRLQSF